MTDISDSDRTSDPHASWRPAGEGLFVSQNDGSRWLSDPHPGSSAGLGHDLIIGPTGSGMSAIASAMAVAATGHVLWVSINQASIPDVMRRLGLASTSIPAVRLRSARSPQPKAPRRPRHA